MYEHFSPHMLSSAWEFAKVFLYWYEYRGKYLQLWTFSIFCLVLQRIPTMSMEWFIFPKHIRCYIITWIIGKTCKKVLSFKYIIDLIAMHRVIVWASHPKHYKISCIQKHQHAPIFFIYMMLEFKPPLMHKN